VINLWNKVTVVLVLSFIFVQISAQYGIFTDGINVYTLYVTFDTYPHILGNAALFAVILSLVTFPKKYDKWRYWVPFQFAIMVIWELIELIITWFALLPPSQMYANVENSIFDVVIGVLTLFMVDFFYEIVMEQGRGSLRAF